MPTKEPSEAEAFAKHRESQRNPRGMAGVKVGNQTAPSKVSPVAPAPASPPAPTPKGTA